MTAKTFEVPCARCVEHPGMASPGSALLCRVCNGTKIQRVSEQVFLARYGAALGPAAKPPVTHILVQGYRASDEAPQQRPSLGLPPDLLLELMMEGGVLLVDGALVSARQRVVIQRDEAAILPAPRTGICVSLPSTKPAPAAPPPRVNPPMVESRRAMLADCRRILDECWARLDKIPEPLGQGEIAEKPKRKPRRKPTVAE